MKHSNRIYSAGTTEDLTSEDDFKDLLRVLKLISAKYGLKLQSLDNQAFKLSGTAEQLALVDTLINAMAQGGELDSADAALVGSLDDFLNSQESPYSRDVFDRELNKAEDNEIPQLMQVDSKGEEVVLASNNQQQNDSVANAPQPTQQTSNNGSADQGSVVLSTMGPFEKPTLQSETFRSDDSSSSPVGILPTVSVKPQSPLVVSNSEELILPPVVEPLPPNVEPVSWDDFITVNQDSNNDIYATVLVNDIDNETLGIDAVDLTGTIGTVTFDRPTQVLTYDTGNIYDSLAVGETATDTFGYTTFDGRGGTASAVVTITIAGVNDAPVGVADSMAVNENATSANAHATFLANDTDVDTSDTLDILSVDTTGTDGTVTFNGGADTLTYSADNHEYLSVGVTTTDSFVYTVSDGNGGTNDVTVTVTVTGVNDAPVAQDDAVTIDEDSTLVGDVFVDNGNGVDSDIDAADTFAVSAVAGGSVGAAVAGSTGGLFTINADGTFSFDANGDFEPLDDGDTQDTSATYTISDGNGGTDSATITVTVTGVNDAPIAADNLLNDEMEEGADTLIIVEADLIVGDTDIEGDTLDITNMTCGVGEGSLSDNFDGTWTYTSPADSLTFSGLATITYTLSDGDLTDTATIQVRVFNMPGATSGDDVINADDINTPHKIDGLGGDDTITGSNVRDILIGGAGDDSILGLDGDDDFIFEGVGNGVDTIDGGAGTDLVLGGTGNDTFSVFTYTGIEEIDMGTGTDTLLGTAGDDNIYFGTTIITDIDIINGNGGTDTIIGTAAGETLDLTNVSLILNVSIDLGAGDDTVRGSQGADTIVVNTGSNTLYGQGGDDTFFISAISGTNNFDGGTGNDDILGSAGDDALVMGSITSIESIDLGAGTDYIMTASSGTGLTLDLSGYTSGVDLLNVEYLIDNTTGVNIIQGSQGADEIRIQTDAAIDTFSGNGGDDNFVFSGVLTSEDLVDGGAGTDTITGSAGDDGLRLGSIAGIEVIDLGAGTDYITTAYTNVGGRTLDLSGFTAGVDLLGVEYLIDQTNANTIIGSQGDDEIRMQTDAAIDTFSGSGGDDNFVFSGSLISEDLIDGGAGTDTITGSAGDDVLVLGSMAGIESIDLGTGTDYMMTAYTNVGGRTLDLSAYTMGVDILGVEYITDNTNANTIIGSQGDDEIVIRVDASIDSFSGGDGNDNFSFTGSLTSEDTVDGGAGTDTITGSAGDDVLMLASMTGIESIDLGAGSDYIMSAYNNVVGRTLDLSAYTMGVDILGVEYITDNTNGNTIIGSQGDDEIVMRSDSYADSFSGGDGNDNFSFIGLVNQGDTIDGGAGTDTITGSVGDDGLMLALFTNIESIDLGTGTDYMMATSGGALDISAYTVGVDLLGLEYIIDNTGGAETITGTDQADEIHMQIDAGADTFNGGDGDDNFVFSGTLTGNDIIDGGLGSDTITGSAGADTLALATRTSIENIDLGAGTDYITTAAGGTLDVSAYTVGVDLLNVEYLIDNAGGAETITGTDTADTFSLQNDIFADTFNGGDGDDNFVFSGAVLGDDIIDGGLGNDTITGSAGDDSLRVTIVGIETIDMGAGWGDYISATATGAGTTLDLSGYTVGVDLIGVDYITDYSGAANIVIGTDQAEWIRIQSDASVDSFDAGDGDDTFMFTGAVQAGDTIDGGAGTDRIYAGWNATVDLSAYTVGVNLISIEYIMDNTSADTIIGTNQADEIHIRDDASVDTFNGGDGDDNFVLSGSSTGNDVIDGGAGTDTLTGSAGDDVLTLASITSIETIDLGTGTDYMMAAAGGALDVSGYTVGVDLLGVEYITDNAAGAETVTGTAQADEIRLQADASADTFIGGDGDDNFVFSGTLTGNDTIDGGAGSDMITGSGGNDALTLLSMSNIEAIDLGAGTDYMRAIAGGVLDVSGFTVGVDLLGVEYITDNAAGAETVTGTDQADEIRLQADASADTFIGGDGDDNFVFSGTLTGNDTIDGGAGNDTITGSGGADALTLLSMSNIEAIDLGAGTDYMMAISGGVLDVSGFTVGVDFLGVEYITDNAAGAETVTGTAQADEIRLQADAFADTFIGGDGDDNFVFSGTMTGLDTISGGAGSDTITGSAGADVLMLASMGSIETINLGGGADYIRAVAGSALDLSGYTVGVDLLGVDFLSDNTGGAETITGTAQNDVFYMQADVNADTFNGGSGNDMFVFLGAAGINDTINGGAGTDYILANMAATLDLSGGTTLVNIEYITDNTNAETIIGSAQNDEIRIQSDASADSFSGGGGADLFYLGSAKGTADILADFDVSENDMIDISNVLSYDSGDGDLISDFVRFTDVDGNPADGAGTVTMQIDVDGTANGVSFQDYFIFDDQSTRLADMIGDGNLVVE